MNILIIVRLTEREIKKKSEDKNKRRKLAALNNKTTLVLRIITKF